MSFPIPPHNEGLIDDYLRKCHDCIVYVFTDDPDYKYVYEPCTFSRIAKERTSLSSRWISTINGEYPDARAPRITSPSTSMTIGESPIACIHSRNGGVLCRVFQDGVGALPPRPQERSMAIPIHWAGCAWHRVPPSLCPRGARGACRNLFGHAPPTGDHLEAFGRWLG